MKPIIAIADPGKGLLRSYMKSKYVHSLIRSGAQVRWIKWENVDEGIRSMLECDGMVFPGGVDIHPSRYGREKSDKCGEIDEKRDEAEMRMMEAFLATRKPILCICRGEQLLNVYFGGTLHQDIKNIQGCKHTHWPGKNRGTHKVRIYPHTKLGKLLGSETETVNSLHHQAVDTLGPGLTASAVSEDGFIEAVEVFGHPFCIGVQWHPEHMGKTNPQQQKIFDAFVAACKT